jgi:hypothetical protein
MEIKCQEHNDFSKATFSKMKCKILGHPKTYSYYISEHDEAEQKRIARGLWTVPFIPPNPHTSTVIYGEILDEAACVLLCSAWKISKSPTEAAIDELAVQIKATKRTIKRWFHNRRRTKKIRILL